MTECVDDLLLIVKGAVMDSCTFTTLEGFLNASSPQQRSHLIYVSDVGIKVYTVLYIYVYLYLNLFIYVHTIPYICVHSSVYMPEGNMYVF